MPPGEGEAPAPRYQRGDPPEGTGGGKTRLCQRKRGGFSCFTCLARSAGSKRGESAGQPSQPPSSPTPRGSGPAEAPLGSGDTAGGTRWGSAPFLPPHLLLSPGGAPCASGAAVSQRQQPDRCGPDAGGRGYSRPGGGSPHLFHGFISRSG